MMTYIKFNIYGVVVLYFTASFTVWDWSLPYHLLTISELDPDVRAGLLFTGLLWFGFFNLLAKIVKEAGK